MQKRNLSINAIRIKQLQVTLILTVIIFLLGAASVFIPTVSAVLGAACVTAYIFMVTSFIKLWYNKYSYELTDTSINIEKGVFVTKTIVIFKSKIQYSAAIQTPLQRIFHTCTVIIHTAGAVVYLSEIDTGDYSSIKFDSSVKRP